jgi:hypothetical protein
MHGTTMDSNISFIISVQWEPSYSMRADGRTYGRNVILVGDSKVIVVFRNFANAQSLRKQLVYCIRKLGYWETGMYLCPWCITKKNRNKNKLIFITNSYNKTFTKEEIKVMHINMQPITKNRYNFRVWQLIVITDLLLVLLNRFNIMLQHASTLVTVFWDVISCGLVDSYKLFGQTCCLQLQGIKQIISTSQNTVN